MTELYGIDVSENDGHNINFSTAPIKFCIVRWGYGSRASQQDKLWDYHLEQCSDNNIPMGVYLYSYAIDAEGAISEANNICARLSEAEAHGYNFPYWLWYDFEDSTQAKNGKSNNTVTVNAFLDRCKELGRNNVGVYTFRNFMDTCLDRTALHTNMLWMADYVYKDGLYHGKSQYMNYDYAIYQYTSTNSNQFAWDSRVGLDQDMCYYDFVSQPVNPTPNNPTDTESEKKKQIEELTEQKKSLTEQVNNYKSVFNNVVTELNNLIK